MRKWKKGRNNQGLWENLGGRRGYLMTLKAHNLVVTYFISKSYSWNASICWLVPDHIFPVIFPTFHILSKYSVLGTMFATSLMKLLVFIDNTNYEFSPCHAPVFFQAIITEFLLIIIVCFWFWQNKFHFAKRTAINRGEMTSVE